MYKKKLISSFRLAIISLTFCAVTSCTKYAYIFTSFNEPANEGLRLLTSDDAKHWKDLDSIFLKPTIGKQKIMRDPSIAQGPDGTFHLVWTCSWKGDNGFGYANSKDLKNWSAQQFIPVMKNELTTVNVWAPEIFYDDENQQFIIIWASTIPFRFAKGVEDEDNNHRMYSIITKDFKSFSEPKLFLDPGFSVIDAVIVKRAVKDYVLVLKDNTRPNRNLKVAYSTNALGPYTNVSETFSPKLTEGPTVLKKGNEYLVYYDAYGDKKYTTLSTKDFKTFNDISGTTFIPKGHKHGTVMRVEKKILRNLRK